MELNIAHIYPELLNLYGDSGNILSLKTRLSKRGIDVKIIEYSLDDDIDFSNTDIIYIGGGTDREQLISCRKLCEKKEELNTIEQERQDGPVEHDGRAASSRTLFHKTRVP